MGAEGLLRRLNRRITSWPDDTAKPAGLVNASTAFCPLFTSRLAPLRSRIAILFAASLLAGCDPGGSPAIEGATPPPFDAFQAGMRLAVGMPLDVAILRIGWQPISGQTTTCGVLVADANPCEVVTFGRYDNNQLLVYVVPTHEGYSVVSSWVVHKG